MAPFWTILSNHINAKFSHMIQHVYQVCLRTVRGPKDNLVGFIAGTKPANFSKVGISFEEFPRDQDPDQATTKLTWIVGSNGMGTQACAAMCRVYEVCKIVSESLSWRQVVLGMKSLFHVHTRLQLCCMLNLPHPLSL